MVTLILILDEECLPSIPAAVRVATGDVRFVFVRKDSSSGFEKLSATSPDLPPLVRAGLDTLAAAGHKPTEVYDCTGAKPSRSAIDAIAELGAQRIVIPSGLGDRPALSPTVRRLLRIAPVDVVLIEAHSPEPPGRILIPQIAGGGAHSLQRAASLGGAEPTPILALADPDAAARSRRVFHSVHAKLSEPKRRALIQSPGEPTLAEALKAEVRPSDLLLFDVERRRATTRMLALVRALRTEKPDVPFAIGAIRDAGAVSPGLIPRALERIRLHAPALTRDERRDVYQSLERGGRLSTDFAVMLALSATIASLGLIQSSTGVVIGAMLVAPLMTPLLAIGMSLVQGNIQLFRKSCLAVAAGVGGALAASMVIGLLSPWNDLSSEIVARGSPNPFDLLIALFSGVAAAYALARPGLVGMLVGVAIAVALVPPLASTGIALVKGDGQVAAGAAVLFITNLLAIVFGSALVFRFFGLAAARRREKTPRWVIVAAGAILLALVPTIGVLVRNLWSQMDQGVHRPYARPLPAAMRDRITARVSSSPGAHIIFMAESDIEHGFGRQIVLACDDDVDPALEEDLRAILSAGLPGAAPVHVFLVRSAARADALRPRDPEGPHMIPGPAGDPP